MLLLIFLSSGLFLGWSLGANDASNVFGTAVGTNMIKFKTAAIICSVFVIMGAVISGAGAAHTLGKLGAVNAIAGAFMVAFAAAVAVLWTIRLGLPVSTSQTIVGAIIGWNLFSGNLTDSKALIKIVLTWALCPLLSAIFAIIFFKITQWILQHAKIHLFRVDAYTRAGLILIGAFCSYSLGANNIANVMGVFVEVSPFNTFQVGIFHVTGIQQLFFLGGLAIAVGVFTYSYKVMATVGTKIFKLTPQAALVVVLAESTVLFLFASQVLESWLHSHGLPALPLVPVSSSQAVIGAVIGIGIAKGGNNIQWKILGNIAIGWVTTPIIAGIISFFCLFFLQNVFRQEVYRPISYKIDKFVLKMVDNHEIENLGLEKLQDKKFANAAKLLHALKDASVPREKIACIIEWAEIDNLKISEKGMQGNFKNLFSPEQWQAIKSLTGQSFTHKWQFHHALAKKSNTWKTLPSNYQNNKHNKELQRRLNYLYTRFRTND